MIDDLRDYRFFAEDMVHPNYAATNYVWEKFVLTCIDEPSQQIMKQINEINAVVITAGSIEASDKKRAAALLTPLDIYTTAGANGQISSALGYLPGVR